MSTGFRKHSLGLFCACKGTASECTLELQSRSLFLCGLQNLTSVKVKSHKRTT